MKTILSAFVTSLLLVACGTSTPTPTEASATPTSATTETKPDVKPMDSAAAKPSEAAPASSPCKEVPATTTKDMASCKAECAKLDDTTPAGSRCIPPRAACMNRCNQMK